MLSPVIKPIDDSLGVSCERRRFAELRSRLNRSRSGWRQNRRCWSKSDGDPVLSVGRYFISLGSSLSFNRRSQRGRACRCERSFIAVRGSNESPNPKKLDRSTFRLVVRVDRIIDARHRRIPRDHPCCRAAINDRPRSSTNFFLNRTFHQLLPRRATRASRERRQACSFTPVIQIEFVLAIYSRNRNRTINKYVRRITIDRNRSIEIARSRVILEFPRIGETMLQMTQRREAIFL